MDKEKISAFYDQYVQRQAKSALNERIFFLFEKSKELGLNSRSTVLELGCGIGAFSYLLSRIVRNGRVEAVDISPESIALAKSRIQRKNIQFRVSDILHYQPDQASYDFITLFDVIEHIPLDEHDLLFKTISGHMSEQSRLLVNIPNPHYIEYDRIHHPEQLQVVDEAVYLDKLSGILFKYGLYIHNFQTHSIWVKDDYQFMMICKNRQFEEIKCSELRSLSHKIKSKLNRMMNNLLYRY